MDNLRTGVLFFLCVLSISATSQEDTSKSNDRNTSSVDEEEIEELVIVGENNEPKTDIRSDTELLLNVAGAGLDPLAAVLSLPGVTFANDYSSEPAVRGSSPSDNNYYVDLVPVRYVFHLFGHSIFNHNLIHSFDLYPAAFSSQYSNATGAIIDVGLRDPRQQRFTTTLDASFIGSAAMVESSITENSAFYASYRRSLIDIFINEEDLGDEEEGVEVNSLPVSDDYQIKATWDIGDQNRLSFLSAGASDKVKATFLQESNIALRDPDLLGPAKVKQRFDSQGLIWDWTSDNQLQQSNWALTHTKELDDFSYGTGQYFEIIADRLMLHGRWLQQLGQHQIIVGASVEDIEYDLDINAKIPVCSDFDPDCPTIDAELIQFQDLFTMQATIAYLEDQWSLSDAFSVRAGIHYLTDDYLEDEQVEPRLRFEYQIGENWETYLGYGYYSQLPKPEEISPATGNPNLEYIQSKHSVIGLKQKISEGWSWQLDLYYKTLENLPLSLSALTDADYLNRFSNDASGEAYGVEVLVNKELTNKLYGWLALSVANSERKNERTLETSEFEFDKPVILNIVANYKLTDSWMFGIKWSLQSGALYSPIVSTRTNTNNPDVIEPVYGDLNSERLPFYHRLDLRAEYTRITGYGMFSFFVDILNAYNADNVQGYSFAPNGEETLNSPPSGFGGDVPVRESRGIPFFPSLGFKIQF